jgi:hypothetical protein
MAKGEKPCPGHNDWQTYPFFLPRSPCCLDEFATCACVCAAVRHGVFVVKRASHSGTHGNRMDVLGGRGDVGLYAFRHPGNNCFNHSHNKLSHFSFSIDFKAPCAGICIFRPATDDIISSWRTLEPSETT